MAKAFSFESGIRRLEEITESLENNGELTLDEALKLYEEGAKLAAACDKKLRQAELKITDISQAEADFEKDGGVSQ